MAAPASRFSDWSHLESFSRFSTQETSLRSFFNGADVSKRMARIRDAITWIRTHWEDYDTFTSELKQSFIENSSTTKQQENMGDRFATLESSGRREWADRFRGRGETEQDFGFLKLYTSEAGYESIFSVLNGAFRTDSLVEEAIRLRSAVFLVELLTIELFNYTYLPDTGGNKGYTGIVYRGMSLSRENLDDFVNLMAKPVEERYWSVPLAFMSCTVERRMAVDFAEKVTSKNPDPTYNRVLLRIHVAGLGDDVLAVYSSRFPTSVVTPICAVDISNLSEFPEEREVVLRGPFFQLVGVSEEETEKGKVLHVLDVLVFNTNRDHPSTMEMEPEEGDRARALLMCLIEGARVEKCAELAVQLGREEDLQAYKWILDRSRRKLGEILEK